MAHGCVDDTDEFDRGKFVQHPYLRVNLQELLSKGNQVFNEIDSRRDIQGSVSITPPNVSPAIGYVEQDDVILSTMTVREAVTMAATLRLPESMPKEEKIRRVDDIMVHLGLDGVADTRVGDTLNKGRYDLLVFINYGSSSNYSSTERCSKKENAYLTIRFFLKIRTC